MEKTLRRFAFFTSFRDKLLLLVLLSSIPALALAIQRNLEQREIAKARGMDTIQSLARLVAANESRFVKNAHQLLATLDRFSFLVRGKDKAFCSVHLENLLKLSPDYLNFGIIESNGTLFASSVAPPSEAVNLGDRSYFQKTMKTRRFAMGEFQVGRLTQQPGLSFGYPIFGDDGELQRVLFATLKLNLLAEAAEHVPLPFGAAVTVFDRNGTLLARLPESPGIVGKSLGETGLDAELLRAPDGILESEGINGEKRIYAVATVTDGESAGLRVAVGIPSLILFSDADYAMKRSLVVLGVVMILALAAGYVFADRALVRPIRNLVGAANRLANADLKSRVPVFRGTAELRELSESFNRMAQNVEKRAADLEDAHQRIKQMNTELEERVTERTAQLSAANKELEAFSYSVSHDLRAPLRHLDGFAQLLKKHQSDRLDEKGHRHLDVISESARKMGTLIDDLLGFSRMGRREMQKCSVDMTYMVQEVIKQFNGEVQNRRIDWIVADLPTVRADPSMMRQVWLNLLSNAVKYTRNREVARVEVTARLDDCGNHIFVVRDNGVGFEMQYVIKLFGVFQRLHTDSEFEGTGIGLANVRRIIVRHGGGVWAEAQLGIGASFYFSLPCPELKNESGFQDCKHSDGDVFECNSSGIV